MLYYDDRNKFVIFFKPAESPTRKAIGKRKALGNEILHPASKIPKLPNIEITVSL
jgi:hypothetical protein